MKNLFRTIVLATAIFSLTSCNKVDDTVRDFILGYDCGYNALNIEKTGETKDEQTDRLKAVEKFVNGKIKADETFTLSGTYRDTFDEALKIHENNMKIINDDIDNLTKYMKPQETLMISLYRVDKGYKEQLCLTTFTCPEPPKE